MLLALQQAATSQPFINLDPAGGNDVAGAWLVCFLTLAVFSFLWKDNPFYKLAEHVFVGLGTAFFALQYYEEGVLQPLYEYIHEGRGLPAGELMSLGGYQLGPEWAIAWRVVPIVLSQMLLFRLVAPTSWAPRWPLAIMVGVYAALKMTGETQSKLVLLLGNKMTSVIDPEGVPWADAVRLEQSSVYLTTANLIFFVGLICALGHFVFTFRRTPALLAVSRVGIVTLMITFGSMFGFTVLGRIALLIERVADLQGYTGPAYSLAALPAAGTDPGPLTAMLSPPVLLAALITLVLLLGRKRAAPTDAPA
jgi:hypothetical protein